MSKRTHVLVIGTGILDLSSAVWLQQAQWAYEFLDKAVPLIDGVHEKVSIK